MHFKLLLSLVALTSSVTAVTTGPYNVGSGHLTEVPSNIFAQQGQVNTVVNQTIGCDVAGPGLNLVGAPFQFQASSALPSRANDSSIYYFGRTDINVGVPLGVTSYFSKAGASSLTANNDAILGVKFTGYRDSPVVNARGNATSTVQITGTPYTSVSLGRFTFDTNVNFSAGQLAAVPSRRFVFQRDQFTFSLSAAGKTASVTCSAGARRQNFGVANIASLPIWTQLARFAIVAVRNETLGTPPLNSTSLVSSYRPLCTFAGIGKKDFEISLGGFKSNRPISLASPGVFSLGQSNFEISNNLTAFLRTKYPSTTQVSLKLSAFNVSISNATPSVKNLLPSGGYAASAKLGAGSFATFPSNAPSSTYPSATFTPIASSIGKGQLAFLSYDNVAGSFELFDTNSASLGSVTFSCSEGAGNFPSIVPFDIA